MYGKVLIDERTPICLLSLAGLVQRTLRRLGGVLNLSINVGAQSSKHYVTKYHIVSEKQYLNDENNIITP